MADETDGERTTEEFYDEHKEAIDEIAEDDDAPESIQALARAVQRRVEEGAIDDD